MGHLQPRRLLIFAGIAVLGGIWLYSSLPLPLRSADRLISDLRSMGHRFDFRQKIATVRRLGEVKSIKAVEPLVAVLDRPWPAESFSSISLSVYEDEDDQLLSAVAVALGSIGDERAVIPLLRAARYSYGNQKRHLGAEVPAAIRQIGSKAVPHLISALTGKDTDLRCGALRALAEIHDQRAVPAIAGVLPEGYSGSCDMGELAAQALGRAGDSGIDALIAASTDARERVRKTAICWLTKTRDPRSVDALVAALGEEYSSYPACDKPLGDAAAEALVAIGPPSVGPLKAASAGVRQGKARDRALAALVQLNGSQSVAMLEEMLSTGTSEQQVAAAKTLATVGNQGLEILLTAVQSPRSRRAALTGLGGTKSAQAIPPLLDALRSSGAEDAEQAKRSLAMLGAVSAPSVLNLLDEARFQPAVYDIFMRGSMAREGGDALLAAHQSSVGRKRLEIARILSDVGERRADEALWQDVRRGGPGSVVTLSAFLIRTGSPEAERLLLQALEANGNTDLALTLLNSGNDKLEKSASTWASRHGYRVNRGSMPNFGPRWGGR